MRTPKPKEGERLFRVYWVMDQGDSLVWAKDKKEAKAKAEGGSLISPKRQDFDFTESDSDDSYISEIVEPDDAGLEAEILENIAEEEEEAAA